jgi:hypothetical protein
MLLACFWVKDLGHGSEHVTRAEMKAEDAART